MMIINYLMFFRTRDFIFILNLEYLEDLVLVFDVGVQLEVFFILAVEVRLVATPLFAGYDCSVLPG